MSARVGSVFLGDFQRHRPPSTPPPASSEHLEDVLESLDGTESPTKTSSSSLPALTDQAPITIDPVLSLELRLRWLEALLLGVRQETRDRKPREKQPELKPSESLIHLAGDVQRRLNAVVESNDGLKKFMHQCTLRPALVGSFLGRSTERHLTTYA